MDILQLKQMLTHFFQEDIRTGDATSQAIFSDQQCKARIIAKTDGVFAGEDVIREGWKLLHDDIRIRPLKKDGERMKKETCSLKWKAGRQLFLLGSGSF